MEPFIYSYQQMCRELWKVNESFYREMTIEAIGRTEDDREILLAVIGQEKAPCHLFVHGGIHGREYMNSALLLKQMRDYLESDMEKYGEKACLHIIPMGNPDGCTISQQGIPGIRKRNLRDFLRECWDNEEKMKRPGNTEEHYFQRWKANARGVDINRNFREGWKALHTENKRAGDRGHPGPEGYAGEYPESEAETKAILTHVKNVPFSGSIAYHSSGNLIYWDYGSKGKLYERDRRLGESIRRVTGYALHSTVNDRTEGGGCSDYLMQELGIPSVTIETGRHPCPLPGKEFPGIYSENKSVWTAAIDSLLEK